MTRICDDAHLKFIRTLPCIVCGDDSATVDRDAAHIRMPDMTVGKNNPGIGQKPHDFFTLPLCRECHTLQHGMNEGSFWDMYGIDPIKTAAVLYCYSGDPTEATKVIMAARD